MIDIDGAEQSFIITSSVVAHSKSARVIVQTNARNSRIAVLSGTVIVKNTLEHHIVELSPGTVYDTELTARAATDGCPSDFVYTAIANADGWLPLFRSSLCKTTLGVISDQQLRASAFASMLDERVKLNTKANASRVRVLSPPTVLNYDISDEAARKVPMPVALLQHYPPHARFSGQTERLVADNP